MKFVDEVEISVEAGHGGAGAIHFLSEKYREFGGPDGGDGGRGGDLYLRANSGMEQLGHLLRRRSYRAEEGESGRARNCTGKDGRDLIIDVPIGTEIHDSASGEWLGDLLQPGAKLLVGSGGKGGLGNARFATSVNQAPRHAQPGLPGDKRELRLGLKLLADAGLVGLPNAGKSTLLRAVSRSDPRVADYAFTTLTPNLGVVEWEERQRRLILADIPGIIEGAHKGAGLGLSFLRHIERVSLLVYLIDLTSIDPRYDLELLRSELSAYSTELARRPSILLLNKFDLIDYDEEFALELAAELSSDELWSDYGITVPEPILIAADQGYNLHLFREALARHFASSTTFAELQLQPLPDEEDQEANEMEGLKPPIKDDYLWPDEQMEASEEGES